MQKLTRFYRFTIDFIDKRAGSIAVLILGILFGYFLSIGSILSMDSQSYIQKELIRSPLYPMLIHITELTFGKGNYLFMVVFQLLFGFSACYYIAAFIRRTYELHGILFLLLLGLLLTPYSFYFGNTILSEGLAYPLFLLTIKFFLESLFDKKFLSFVVSVVFLTLLILTRRQYIFLYVVEFLGCLYLLYYTNTKRLLPKLTILGILIASFILPNLIEQSYHRYYNGHATTVPFLGIQIMAMPLYLASDKDVALFSDPKEAQIFSLAKKTMKEKQFDSTTLWKENEGPEYYHYYMNYNNVVWGSLHPALIKNNVTNWMEIDKILIHMFPILMQAQGKRVASLYLRNVIHSMGGYYNFILILFAFICSAYFHVRRLDKLSLGLFFAILINYGNYFLVALVEPAMTRYTFSTQIILTSLLIITVYYSLRNYYSILKKEK